MKTYWIFMTTLLLVSCKQDHSNKAYIPFNKTIALRELGPQDELLQKLYTDYYSNPTNQAQKDQNIIIDYLTENKILADKTDSGVYYKIYDYGTGVPFVRSQQFVARYTGYFLDGRIFDSNVDTTDPLIKRVGEMIQGWNETLLLCSPQSKVSLFIPSHMAYGQTGVKNVVPPNTVLAFDIEFLH